MCAATTNGSPNHWMRRSDNKLLNTSITPIPHDILYNDLAGHNSVNIICRFKLSIIDYHQSGMVPAPVNNAHLSWTPGSFTTSVGDILPSCQNAFHCYRQMITTWWNDQINWMVTIPYICHLFFKLVILTCIVAYSARSCNDHRKQIKTI